MISAGRVLIMPRGAYNPLATYEMLDIVSYNGSSYIAKGTTTGNLPTDGTYWQLSAYGGQAANMAGNFAELETSSVASAIHYENDIFVDENSQLMKATQTINIGDTIDENVNCTPTTVEALISYLSSYVDSLDSLNRKIQGAIEIAVQTDLHSLAIGEYYKKQTTFYVTNAPTGINQEASATFRLTVEAALDNASQASSPLFLTLRTPDGKVYTQGFDGTTWGYWEQSAAKSAVDTLSSEIQTLTNQVKDMNNVYGSKNLLPFNLVDIVAKNTNGTWSGNKYTVSGVTYTFNADGTITINGTRTTSGGVTLSEFSLEAGKKYKYSIGNPFNLSNTAGSNIQGYDGTTWVAVGNIFGTETEAEFESNSAYSKYRVNINSNNGVTFSNLTIKPMIRLASIEDDTYQPYAKTNQQLTQDTTALLDNTEVNGAVNMLNFSHASEVIKGYTFTNTDGVVTVTGSRASGETGNADHNKTITLPKGTYKISGCPSGGSENTWRVLVNINNGAKYAFDYGDGAVFTLTEESTLKVYCTIMANYSDTVNLTFKPMITVPSYNGDYVPYAKSNKELTEELSEDSANIVENGITASFRKWGKVCTVSFTGAFNADFAYDAIFLNIPSGFAPKVNCQMLSTNKPSSVQDRIVLNIGVNGTINVAGTNVASGDVLRGSFTYVTA